MPPNSYESLPIKNYAAVFTDKSSGQNVDKPDAEGGANLGITNSPRSSIAQYRRDNSSEANTVSRFSYELDRYRKNAMIIFHVPSFQGSDESVETIRKSFEKWRFEVEVYDHATLTGNEAKEICDEFFKRDFSEYGAVAVVVLAPVDYERIGYWMNGSVFCKENPLKSYFDSYSHTLLGKPKIFILQEDNYIIKCDRIIDINPEKNADVLVLSLPATVSHRDNACPKGLSNHNHPVDFLCEQLEDYADHQSLQNIIDRTITILKEKWPFPTHCRFPFVVSSTLSKDVMFWRNAQ